MSATAQIYLIRRTELTIVRLRHNRELRRHRHRAYQAFLVYAPASCVAARRTAAGWPDATPVKT
jgi:hypothetical protein